MNANSWYVAVGETTAGPAATELVIKGIEHLKVPPEALVCPVGAGQWAPLAEVEAFHAAVIRSYPPPPPASAEARYWLEHGFHFPPPAALPRFDDGFVARSPEGPRPSLVSAPEIDFEVVLDEPPALDEPPVLDEPRALAIDWRDPFESYFLLGADVALPEERALLESLSSVSRETFLHEEALWNLALCLAYGSDALGAAAARAFFDAINPIADQAGVERLEWMGRTLRSDGFVPSGIRPEAGQRAVRRLRSSCPPALCARLS